MLNTRMKHEAGEERRQREADQGERAGDLVEDRIGPGRRIDADRQRDQQRQHLRCADHAERGRQALQDQRIDVHAADEREAPVAVQHGGEPVQVAHRDRIIEAELGAQRGLHRRRDGRIGRQLAERIARRQRQHGEQHDADAEQARDRDEQASDRGSGSPALRGGDCRASGSRDTSPAARRCCCPSRSAARAGSSPTAATLGRVTTGMTTTFLITRSFMAMNSAARLTGLSSLSLCSNSLSYSAFCQRVMLRPWNLLALLATSLDRNCRMNTPGSGCVHRRRVHLEVAGEVRIGVQVGDVRREEHRRGDRLDLDRDAGLLAGLLDDLLGLLARRIDRGLIDRVQLHAVLFPHAVGARLPAGVVQQLDRLVDVELVVGVLRDELVGRVDEVGGVDRRCGRRCTCAPRRDRPAG